MALTAGVLIAWDVAAAEARAGRAAAISRAHVAMGLCKLCDADLDRLRAGLARPVTEDPSVLESDATELRESFGRMGVDPVALRRRLRALAATASDRTRQYTKDDGIMHRDRMSRRAFRRAADIAAEAGGAGTVHPRHLLQALLETPDEALTQALVELAGAEPTGAAPAGAGGDREKPGTATPTIDRFGRDLTALAKAGRLAPVVGRREEMRTLARSLVRQRTSSAILVGEPGVGKTSVVEGLATLAASAGTPPALAGLRFVELPVAALVAGTKYRGELEERVDAVVKEAVAAADLVLFVDEIHLIAQTGRGPAAQVGQLLKPVLARGEVRWIGATTFEEYHRHIEADRALQRRFQLIVVDEPSRAEALEILTALRSRFAEHFGVEITDEALTAAVNLTHRYLPDLRLPDKAIEVIDQACAGARIVTLSPDAAVRALDRVGRAEVAAVVAARARVPVERLTQDEARRLLGMEAVLGARIVGQRPAVRAVCDVVRTARAGLADPRRPAGVLLFAGPTGTGKTELAKALAEFLFGDDDKLVRIDMSEYKERHSVSRLVGSPPGYLGHGDEGQLTGPVRTNPYRVVLFDEIEKAHPEVLDLLLQLLDDGRLTDAMGRRASFNECVVVLTTNLGGATAGRPRLGFGAGDRDGRDDRETHRQRVLEAVRGALRPELVGRIGDPVVFDPLSAAELSGILDRLLAKVRGRLAEQDVALRVDAAAAELLVHEGHDPSRGARELERVVERLVSTPVATALLDGRIGAGGEVVAEARDGAIVLRFAGPARQATPGSPR